MEPDLDVIVLGAGLRGLSAALEWEARRPAVRLLVVDAAPHVGGRVRTQRTNGFSCELGPFAFDRAEVEPVLARLSSPPRILECTATSGWVFDGDGLRSTPVEPRPVSFATGAEEVVQACRRQLGNRFALARAAVRVRTDGATWHVTLGGDVPTEFTAPTLVLALPTATAAGLLAAFDPELPSVAARLRSEAAAFVFLGGNTVEAPWSDGYGIVPTEGISPPVVEAIFCQNAFPGRALPGRFLVRCEVRGENATAPDDGLVRTATDELRRWTGGAVTAPFTKVHRFDDEVADGARAECRVRLAGVAARAPGLSIA